MSSGVGDTTAAATAVAATLRGPGASGSAADTETASPGCTSLSFSCTEPGCIAADATERTAVLEALALAMTSRAASEETSAAKIPADAQAKATARIRDEDPRLPDPGGMYSLGSGLPSKSERNSGTDSSR